MDYQIEEVSPVKRRINVKIPAEEANAAIMATIALYRRSVEIDGFRKGKVPSSVVEAKFKKQIYGEATSELVNYQLNEILSETKIAPISRIEVDSGTLVKDEEFNYSFSFEIAPKIDLPEYVGVEAEQEEVSYVDEDVNRVIDRIRQNLAEFEEITEKRTPVDGELVTIDFSVWKDDKPVEGISAENFEMILGESQALPTFEALVKTIASGDSGEGEIAFPEDFLNKELAGNTALVKITVKAIKERKLPELNDELAQKAGGVNTLDELREMIGKSYIETRSQIAKSAAQKSILDKLTSGMDFPLPDSMVEDQIERKIDDMRYKLERRGKSLESTGKTAEQLHGEFLDEARDLVKKHLFLLAVAEKESLSVSESEIDDHLRKMAKGMGREFTELKKFHEENNLMFALKDRLLSDKAVDFIYSRAIIKEVPASSIFNAAQAAEQGKE